MNFFDINVESRTRAEKAKVLLMRNNIRSTVLRTTGRGGCRFSLRIFSDRETACPILSRSGISC